MRSASTLYVLHVLFVRATKIDRESVNSIALDDEPHDTHDRLMIAALVGLNQPRTVMQARNTTLMPNIHGLPGLMALLFCPTAELRFVYPCFVFVYPGITVRIITKKLLP